MEFLSAAELIIPAYQMMLLLLVSTIALLFGRTKLALIINYLFAVYWGFVLNRHFLLDYELGYWGIAYWIFGIGIAIFASVGFLVRDH